ncbi:MAG: response regulator [Motiliproteus sp.]
MSAGIEYSKQRVLLIDSSGNMRSTIKSMLGSIGFDRVQAMTTSKRALEMIAETDFDIILLGHNIHDRYSGLQLLEEARFKGLIKPSCSWILMSSDSSQESILLAIEVQPDEVIIKPFSMEELRQRVDYLCRRSAALAPIEKAMERNAPNRAIKLCDSLLAKSDPYYDQAQMMKGRLLLEAEQYDKAEPIFEHYYWEGKDIRQGYFLAECRFQLGRQDEAQELLESLVRKHPLMIAAYDLLAKIHEAKGDLEQAQNFLKEGTSRSPLGIKRQLELGRIATHTKQLDVAEQAYRKSIHLGEKSFQAAPDPYLRLANIQRLQMGTALDRGKQDKLVEIDRLLAQAKRKFSGNPQLKLGAELLMAKVFEDMGDNDRAASSLDKAQTIADEEGLVSEMGQIRQQVLAEAEPRVQQQPLGEPAAQKGPVQDPAMSAKVNRIGVRNYMAGKPGQAIRYFGMAFEHDNSNASALLNLAQMFLEAARDTPSRSDERLKMFHRYLKLAERLPLMGVHKDKFNHLKKLSNIKLDAIPEGPLGNLLK